MTFWIYVAVFMSVVTTDQISKRWAMRALPIAALSGAAPGFAWSLTRSRSFERLGTTRAVLVWVLAGACGASLCLAVPGGGGAALGGVAAWAAAASNLIEWSRHGVVVDWLRLWPRSLTNLADAVLILGSVQLLIWTAAS